MKQACIALALSIAVVGCGSSEDPPASPGTAADASGETRSGEPAAIDLWTPAAIGDVRTLQARIAEGGDVNALDPNARATAIALAADFGQIAAVKMLLDAEADPNARNGNGSTPALGAAFFGRPDCLQVLLDAGADPTLADENGTTTYTALIVPWEITKAIGDLMMMPLDKGTLRAGRDACRKLLESR